jgi:ATP-dependent RNA helicase DDX49/DBP8
MKGLPSIWNSAVNFHKAMAPGRLIAGNLSGASSDASLSDGDEVLDRAHKRRRISKGESPVGPRIKYDAPSRIRKTEPTLDVNTAKGTLQTVPTTDTSFEALNVAPWLLHSMSAMEIKHPTPIQRACIPEILQGHDCIGGSRTGTGKTIAFAVPILQKWSEDPFGIYAVVLTPTRELALQIYEQFQALGSPQSLKSILITGGTEMRPQAVALAQRPHIVIGTPGRLADHVRTSGRDTIVGLSRARVIVLDEADRLLASGPGSMLPDVDTCLSALPPAANRHTLLFTATITAEVRALKSLPRPKGRAEVFVAEINAQDDSPRSLIPQKLKQTYLQVPMTHKDAFLHVLLSVDTISALSSTIIFCNRTKTADLLHRVLLSLNHSVTSLHSRMPQSQRNKNLSDFRSSKARLLVATDVAARGLDIPSVALVINYDVPRNPDDYIHRVGRTARAGRGGMSITFVGQRDVELILAIEKHVGSRMAEWKQEGVNVETRVLKGRILKDVGEAKMEAMRDVELNKDLYGQRKKLVKRVNS